MKDYDPLEAQASSIIEWVKQNKIVAESGEPIEFDNHRFLALPYRDLTPRQAIRKSAQVGWSTLAILKSFHLALFCGTNVIYTLPSRSIVKDFVVPKVNPLIDKNPIIRDVRGRTDSISLKKIGDRFIYFRGSWEDTEAITITADVLINDEFDRSNQRVVGQYQSRLGASKFGWVWRFSNPTTPGFGVDEDWLRSDQKHWLVKCHHCGHITYFDWLEEGEANDNKIHFVDLKREIYACGNCGKELSNDDRQKGRWVEKHPGREVSGYWISQMMAPWIPARDIVRAYYESRNDPAYFYNFILGKPYQEKDMSVDRQTIIDCLVPGKNQGLSSAMGVDNGIVKHYVIGNNRGIFAIGKTEDWDEIERLRNRYRAYMVIDANPYPTHPKKLAKKYSGKAHIHYYRQDRSGMEIMEWGKGDKRGVVLSDRTKLIDLVVDELNSQEIVFNMIEGQLEDYITHWGNTYRVIEPNRVGIMKGVWKTPEGKPDHYAHATVLWRVAMEKARVSTGIGGVRQAPRKQKFGKPAIVISKEGTIPAFDIQRAARMSGRPTRRDWKKV